MSQLGISRSIPSVNSLAMSSESETSPRQTFSALASEHHRMALLYARTPAGKEHTARDLTEDAFFSAWQNWSRFDVTRDFSSWLRGIIRNKWREHCRKNLRESSRDDEALPRHEDFSLLKIRSKKILVPFGLGIFF